ncbi:hypothetical protein Bbelb_079730 [Branchiostoma belcheri]|nr:hypothetical protein Bbelb_079730 [Branchiostoma belcheri]
MECPGCGETVGAKQKFCHECGTQLPKRQKFQDIGDGGGVVVPTSSTASAVLAAKPTEEPDSNKGGPESLKDSTSSLHVGWERSLPDKGPVSPTILRLADCMQKSVQLESPVQETSKGLPGDLEVRCPPKPPGDATKDEQVTKTVADKSDKDEESRKGDGKLSKERVQQELAEDKEPQSQALVGSEASEQAKPVAERTQTKAYVQEIIHHPPKDEHSLDTIKETAHGEDMEDKGKEKTSVPETGQPGEDTQDMPSADTSMGDGKDEGDSQDDPSTSDDQDVDLKSGRNVLVCREVVTWKTIEEHVGGEGLIHNATYSGGKCLPCVLVQRAVEEVVTTATAAWGQVELDECRVELRPVKTQSCRKDVTATVTESAELLVTAGGSPSHLKTDSQTTYKRHSDPGRCYHKPRTTLLYTMGNATTLARTEWTAVWEALSVEEKVSTFYSIITALVDRHFPVRVKTVTKNNKPWMTDRVKRAIVKRQAEFQRHGKSPTWRRLRNKVKTVVRQAKNWHYRNCIQQLRQENPSKWWACINKELGRTRERSGPITTGGPSAVEVAESTNTHFSKSWCQGQPLSLFPLPRGATCVDLCSIGEVKALLKSINPRKASGPDDLPSWILKEHAEDLAPIITHLFNEPYENGTVPLIWKSANVAPVPKSAEATEVCDMRPISLLPVLAKLMERCILKRLLPSPRAVIKDQYAYMRGSSTTIALVRMVQTWLTALDSKKPTLQLSGRRQRVVVNGVASSWMEPTSGVPQGGVLSPYLFLLFMASRTTVHPDTMNVGYADDVSMSRTIPVGQANEDSTLEDESSHLDSWADTNNMLLNGKKSQLLQICLCRSVPSPPRLTLGGVCVPWVNSAKGLGFILDKNLTLQEQVMFMVQKASRRLHYLRLLCKQGTSVADLFLVYLALVRPVLEYGHVILVGCSKEQERAMERVQRRALRIISRGGRRDVPEVPTLKSRREDAAVKLFTQMLREDHPLHDLRKFAVYGSDMPVLHPHPPRPKPAPLSGPVAPVPGTRCSHSRGPAVPVLGTPLHPLRGPPFPLPGLRCPAPEKSLPPLPGHISMF